MSSLECTGDSSEAASPILLEGQKYLKVAKMEGINYLGCEYEVLYNDQLTNLKGNPCAHSLETEFEFTRLMDLYIRLADTFLESLQKYADSSQRIGNNLKSSAFLRLLFFYKRLKKNNPSLSFKNFLNQLPTARNMFVEKNIKLLKLHWLQQLSGEKVYEFIVNRGLNIEEDISDDTAYIMLNLPLIWSNKLQRGEMRWVGRGLEFRETEQGTKYAEHPGKLYGTSGSGTLPQNNFNNLSKYWSEKYNYGSWCCYETYSSSNGTKQLYNYGQLNAFFVADMKSDSFLDGQIIASVTARKHRVVMNNWLHVVALDDFYSYNDEVTFIDVKQLHSTTIATSAIYDTTSFQHFSLNKSHQGEEEREVNNAFGHDQRLVGQLVITILNKGIIMVKDESLFEYDISELM